MNKIRTELHNATKIYPKYQVLVFEFKFDTIRQESYWVLILVKEYRLRRDAELFRSRF